MRTAFDILRHITERLAAAGIAFMLTGSMAMNYHVQPRMTRDIDVVVDLEMKDAPRMAALFSPGDYADLDMIREAVARTAPFNIIENVAVVKVDVVIRKSTGYIGTFSTGPEGLARPSPVRDEPEFRALRRPTSPTAISA